MTSTVAIKLRCSVSLMEDDKMSLIYVANYVLYTRRMSRANDKLIKYNNHVHFDWWATLSSTSVSVQHILVATIP